MNEVEVNSYGVNKLIKYKVLSDDKMREIGFTDYAKDSWCFCKSIEFPKDKRYRFFYLSFNVSIPKNSLDEIRIDILNEDFLQPYDYQYMLYQNPNFEPALIVKEQVEKWMKYLQDNGVLSGHKPNDYI